MLFVFITDTHIDSAFGRENESIRNGELIAGFRDAVGYAKAIGAKAVVLGGDLFDTPYPSQGSCSAVRSVIKENADLQFIAVCGNHDPIDKTDFYKNLPDNFHLFSERISGFDFGGITFYGSSETEKEIWNDFRADGRYVIVSHPQNGHAEFENSGAALCLLGHVHKSAVHTLRSGGIAIYGGALAGRGFDECGQKGFYVIDSDDMSYRFITSRARIYKEYELDVANTRDTGELIELISTLPSPPEKEIARLILTGDMQEPYDIDCEKLCGIFPQYCEIKDCTLIAPDLQSAASGNTLEGEFLRILSQKLVFASEPEKIKIREAMKEGILALRRKQ